MAESNTARLEAFCDGVFAIALTLLVIDIKIPASETYHTNTEFWLVLKHLLPTILAFLLSFITILITWVNHHNALKLIKKTSPQFIYANGLLLLTVVFIPFPTSLLGDNVMTDHATPAVVLYSAVFALQALGWNLMGRAGLNPANPLALNEKAEIASRGVLKNTYIAMFVYGSCAVLAFWFPLSVAIFVACTWVFWLIYGISIKPE